MKLVQRTNIRLALIDFSGVALPMNTDRVISWFPSSRSVNLIVKLYFLMKFCPIAN